MERRTLRRDRQDLQDLQLSLQQEIEAKTKIAKDLSDITSQHAEMERYMYIHAAHAKHTHTPHTHIHTHAVC